jgi:4-hydroxybutyrate CoA-transferase
MTGRPAPIPGARQVEAPGWTDLIREGDRIFVSSGCGEPETLIDDIQAAVSRDALPSVTVYQMFRGGSLRLLHLAGPTTFRFVAITAGRELIPKLADGSATHLELSIYETATALERGDLAFDVALIQVSRPDRHGALSLGISVDFAAQAVAGSRLVVAEVNHQMPRALGDSFVFESQVDLCRQVTRPLYEMPPGQGDETSRRIGENVATIVPDGATIEVGVGAVTDGVAEALRSRRHLGIHTGLLSTPLLGLIEGGAVTNERKTWLRGRTVANQVRGTRQLYAFLDDNPGVAMMPASYTHAPDVLARQPAFHAINSAIEVDCLGQANCEFIGGERVATSGGVIDFVRAGVTARDGASIIAMKSTAQGGTTSRIVPTLRDGHVTLSGALADVLVTEHGIALLRGKSARERAEAIIRVADPRFEQSLKKAALKG